MREGDRTPLFCSENIFPWGYHTAPPLPLNGHTFWMTRKLMYMSPYPCIMRLHPLTTWSVLTTLSNIIQHIWWSQLFHLVNLAPLGSRFWAQVPFWRYTPPFAFCALFYYLFFVFIFVGHQAYLGFYFLITLVLFRKHFFYFPLLFSLTSSI